MQGQMHFTDAMTSQLDADVKLVGPNINCGGMPLPRPGSDMFFSNPHVQSFAVATDAVGLDIIRQNSSVLACYSRVQETVVYSELGLSASVLEAGYNLGCFMVRR